eukprot:1394996-Amorphochlora_amoeboformis.AAC.1
MDDPFDIQTSSDEEVATYTLRNWPLNVENGGDIGAQLTVEEIENFEGIVTGNYTPLAAAPVTYAYVASE